MTKEYGRKPYLSKSYREMMTKTSNAEVWTKVVEAASEFEKPYIHKAGEYQEMQYVHPTAPGISSWLPPEFDFESGFDPYDPSVAETVTIIWKCWGDEPCYCDGLKKCFNIGCTFPILSAEPRFGTHCQGIEISIENNQLCLYADPDTSHFPCDIRVTMIIPPNNLGYPIGATGEYVFLNVEECEGDSFSATYDAEITNFGDTGWASIHDAASGQVIDDTDIKAIIDVERSDPTIWISRSFLSFDLSAIPLTATVCLCSLFFSLHTDGWPYEGATVIAQEGTFSTPASTADFDSFIGNSFGSKTLDSIGGYTPVEIFFNAIGIAYIQSVINGTAKICMREYGYDYLNIKPSSDEDFTYSYIATKEASNEASLRIVYS